MSLASLVRIKWGHLSTDPAQPSFWQKHVSVPTPECPNGSVVSDDTWYFPREIVSGGNAAYARQIDFNVPCGNGVLTDAEFAPLLLICKRFAIAKMKHPVKKVLHLSSIKRHLTVVFDLVDGIASGPWLKGKGRLADQTLKEIETVVTEMAAGWREDAGGYEALRRVFKEIQQYGARGFLGDWFEEIALADLKKLCKCAQEERKRGELPPDRRIFTTPPMPDLYCIKTVEIATFYNDVLSDAIIDNARELVSLRGEEAAILKNEPAMTIWDKRRARVRFESFARDYRWPVEKLPFRTSYVYPPRTSGELIPYLGTLQSGNAQLTALETGARSGEILGMDSDCLFTKPSAPGMGAIKSLRFKNSFNIEGQEVEWDVTERVVKAITVQLALAEALGAPGVWSCVHWEDFGKRATGGLHDWLQRFAERHFLDPKVGRRTAVSLQRFRTLLARLIVLSEDGHLRLAKRILGHASIETTIAYVKMSPYIQAELAQARRLRRASVRAAPAARAPDVRTIGGQVSAQTLSSIVIAAQRRGNPMRLLAPGILFSGEGGAFGGAATLTFDNDAVRRDAFAFAIENMCNADVRTEEHLFRWFLAEARRLDANYEAGEIFLPRSAREGAVYDAVRLKEDRDGNG